MPLEERKHELEQAEQDLNVTDEKQRRLLARTRIREGYLKIADLMAMRAKARTALLLSEAPTVG